MAKSREELVEEALEREAIRDLANRYIRCLWRNQIEELVDLYDANGALQLGGGKEVRGRAALLEFYGKTLPPTRPYAHNHVVELKGKDRAVGWLCAELRDAGGSMPYAATATVEDEYVKVNGAWKFANRSATMFPFK